MTRTTDRASSTLGDSMMNEEFNELYLKWLYSQIRTRYAQRNTNGTYWNLLRQMHQKEFVWLVANDDNRIADGLEIRAEFINSVAERDGPHGTLDYGCSVLEVLIALSRKLEFEAGGEACNWAWQLIENLELDKYRDPGRRGQEQQVEVVLETLIWRTYSPNGMGGFFPLISSDEDQTRVEIWYQMAAYLAESQEL